MKNSLISNCYQLLLPLTRLLLRLGISWREMSELTKRAYVEAAAQDYAEKRRPVNTSRLAILTGLTRKEVKRIRDLLAAGNCLDEVRSGAADAVLLGWHSDPEFRAANGLPAILDIEGEDRSFNALTRRFAGDLPPGAMLKELVRVGAVERLESGRLRLLRDHYAQVDITDATLDHVAQAMTTMGRSLVKYVEEQDCSGDSRQH